MDKIFIIHFSPPELYPPLQNFIRVLEQADPGQKITIVTTSPALNTFSNFNSMHPNIRISRLGKSGESLHTLTRLWSYAVFYAGCLWQLFYKRPSTVLYYETLSSFPVYLYKRFINPGASVMIHYHEYTSPGEYENGMLLTKLFHRYEHWLYPRVQWLSHTNAYRMQLFLDDIKPLTVAPARIIPNYPPAAWYRHKKDKSEALPVQFVYVGALSLDTMYVKEMAEMIITAKGTLTWDIYTRNITDEAREYISGLQSPWITLKGGLEYTALPETLNQYDIGVILYKGHIQNYVYNAPNKLFEYLAVGLRVWVPDVMKGAMEYVNAKDVLAVDFESIQTLGSNHIRKAEYSPEPGNEYFCERAFMPLASQLLNGGKK